MRWYIISLYYAFFKQQLIELLFDYIYERMDDQEIRERVRESVFNEWNKDNNLVNNTC